MTDLHQSLRDLFGFAEFRPLQEEAVEAACAGCDALVVMPTGAGKSLCFQLPAALATGVTLVVSPLIALMHDQVNALTLRPAFAALGVACVTSGQSADEQRAVLFQLRSGSLRLLYVAPERFRSAAFMEALLAVPIARLVVDEAHCISEWGHDFRPDYLTLRAVSEQLGSPPMTALTATATRRVQDSIAANLGLRDPLVLAGGFNRPNLHLSVYRCRTEREREERLARALPRLAASGGSGLVYVATRKQCEHLGAVADAALSAVGLRAGVYHAGLDSDERTHMQRQWLAGELHTLVATSAFGMGIDKPDVRFVIHCACPDSLESYYQEAGRAGRDGAKSRCVVLYHFTDRRTREWFIDNDSLTPSSVLALHQGLTGQAESGIVALSRAQGARLLNNSPLALRLALGELERAGLIQRLGETESDIHLRVVETAFPADALRRIGADLQAQRTERLRRLDEMTDYCKTTACRRRTILDYFGDRQEPPPSPFCCDNCDTPAPSRPDKMASAPPRGSVVPMPACLPSGDIHALLQGIDALRPTLGRARLNKLLRGAHSRDMERFNLTRCPLYATLKGLSRDAVDAFLAALIEDGLLRVGDEDEYFVCTLTGAGRDAWQERTPLSIPYPGLPRTPREPGGDTDNLALYDALRLWRTGEASAQSLPPYCVFSDKTLREIARQEPRTEDELRAVSGVGPAKLERYGDAVLALTCAAE